jgi:hypothetical protein
MASVRLSISLALFTASSSTSIITAIFLLILDSFLGELHLDIEFSDVFTLIQTCEAFLLLDGDCAGIFTPTLIAGALFLYFLFVLCNEARLEATMMVIVYVVDCVDFEHILFLLFS